MMMEKKKKQDYTLEELKLPSKRAKLLIEEPTKETKTKTKSTIFQVIYTSSITRSLAIF